MVIFLKLRINENEVTNTYYGVFETGGSIGSHKEDDFYGRAGSKTGKLVKVFNNDTDAKEYAKRMRKSLSPGERKYYGYGYFIKPLTSNDTQNSVVQTMINNINESFEEVYKELKEDSFNDKLTDSFVVEHGPKIRYMCHVGNENSPNFVASLSKISPYDDAEYVWARIYENKKVDFIKNGKVVDKMQLSYYDEEDYESLDSYIDDCLDIVVLELADFNKKIKPVMVYN